MNTKLEVIIQKRGSRSSRARAFAGVSTGAELFTAPTLEFATLRNRADLEAMAARFVDRFTRRLKEHGFDRCSAVCPTGSEIGRDVS